MPGIPLLFTDSTAPADTIYRPLPGLFLSDDLYLGDDVFLDDGPTAYALWNNVTTSVAAGIVETVTPTPAVAFMPVPGLPVVGDIVETVTPQPAVAFMPVPAFSGQDLVVSVTPVPAVAFMPVPGTSGGMADILVPSVRELPPLRLTINVTTPNGRHFRWAEDEWDPADVPSGLRFSDTMPGGYENWDCTLPRKIGQEGADLERLSTITTTGAGGRIVWEGRLERAPRSSGDQVSVSPSAVGFQARLEDDKSAQMIYVDRDLGRWQSMSATRRSQLVDTVGSQYQTFDSSVEPDSTLGPTFGIPNLTTKMEVPWSPRGVSIAAYDAGPGSLVAQVMYGWTKTSPTDPANSNFAWVARGADNDTMSTGLQSTANLRAAGPVATSTLGFTTAKRFLEFAFAYEAPGTTVGEYAIKWTNVAVFGDHGLPVYGTEAATAGLAVSDIVSHAVSRWAPDLNLSVQPSAFVLNHSVFSEFTTAGEIVRQTSRFGLQDWAIWQNKTFHWGDRGSNARFWRARVGPAQLEETGPQVDRVWESVVVQYQDVDGSTKTVGPPGSGADYEDASLKDLDPDNPSNKVGIVRRALLTMGTSARDPTNGRPSMPVEIGRRFLEEQKLLDSSGRATFVGHVESDKGVVHPYWAPRAGDYVSFIDAADSSPRRIVRSEKDHGSRTCSVDLDAPPQALDALLERLGVGLVDLGFS